MEKHPLDGPSVMATETDYNLKASACVTKIKRTFLLTFALMFLTLSVMYGTTEHFSNNFRFIKNVGGFKTNVSVVSRNSKILHRILTESGNFTFISELRNGSKEYANKAIENKGNLSVHKSVSPERKSTSIALKPDNSVSVKKPETARESQGTGSKEFSGMPDPCASPRRKTGVEDILCMKRPQFLPEYKNPCWMDGNEFRCLPYFHLIGICKSGTSDFFKRLLLHPDIVPNKGIFGKEIWYWSWKRFYVKDRAGKFKIGMTLTEFTRQFDTKTIRDGVDSQGHHIKVTGHGDPMDIWDRFREEAIPQNVPGAEELLWTTPYAVKHINPNVKLLLMLRDPIERMYSHYFHSGMGTSAQSFHSHVVQSIDLWKKCLNEHSIRHCIYSPAMKRALRAPIYTSFYIVHLREWLKVFPRKQLFIFRNEDYSADIKGTMRQIFEFLDVSIPDETTLNKMKTLPHFYETKSKKRAGPMLPSTKALLIDLYRPYTEELASFLKDDRYAFRDRSFAR